jgi:hypothetical protein
MPAPECFYRGDDGRYCPCSVSRLINIVVWFFDGRWSIVNGRWSVFPYLVAHRAEALPHTMQARWAFMLSVRGFNIGAGRSDQDHRLLLRRAEALPHTMQARRAFTLSARGFNPGGTAMGTTPVPMEDRLPLHII